MASPVFSVHSLTGLFSGVGKAVLDGKGHTAAPGQGIRGMDRICQKFGAKFSLLPKMSKMQNFYCIDQSNVV